ncbi:MAG: glutathione peroxidase [Sulfurospirillum sp.]|nr:glutathione peroxidase [Sulfurospirillum sp.]
MSFYEFEAKDIDGNTVSMQKYKNKVVLIVNVASKCGFTPQYAGLEKLHEKYSTDGLAILGFPSNQFMHQEPEGEAAIKSFCQLTYGVAFDMFAKIDVNGANAHPLYVYLKKNAPEGFLSDAIKWNFTKFLINKEGKIVQRYAPSTTPESIETDIKKLL